MLHLEGAGGGGSDTSHTAQPRMLKHGKQGSPVDSWTPLYPLSLCPLKSGCQTCQGRKDRSISTRQTSLGMCETLTPGPLSQQFLKQLAWGEAQEFAFLTISKRCYCCCWWWSLDHILRTTAAKKCPLLLISNSLQTPAPLQGDVHRFP